MILRLSKYTLLLAVASLFFRVGIWKPYTLQPYEVLSIISFALLMIHFFFSRDTRFLFILKKYSGFFIGIGSALLLGTVVASMTYTIDHEAWIAIFKQFFYFLTVSMGFFCACFFGKEYVFRIECILCMCIPLLFAIFLPFLNLANTLSILGNGFVLTGFSGNPSILAFYLLIPFGTCLTLTFYERKGVLKTLYSIATLLSFSLILWTGSRGAWLGVACFCISIIFLYTKKPLKIILYGISILMGAIVSFLLLAHPVKVMVLDRIVPSITNNNPSPHVLENTPIDFTSVTSSLISHSGGIKTPAIPYQDRDTIWPQAWHTFIQHPFGLGPEYSRISHVIVGPDGKWIIAHSTFLQAGLSGGIVLLVLILYMTYSTVKKIYRTPISRERTFFFSLWISFIIALLFNDHLFAAPWVWIVAGLIYGINHTTSNTEQSPIVL